MSAIHSYSANPRTALGSFNAAKMRKQGQIPVTVSRAGKDSTHLQIEEKLAQHLASHVIHLCKIDVGGNAFTALKGEIVKDCMTDKIKHIDLKEVDEKSEITVDVAVIPDARNCPGVKAGGIVELRARTVKLKCKASEIPDSIGVELSDVQIMQSITVSKLVLPKGTKLVTPPKTLLLSVVIPRGMKAAADDAAATPADGAAAPADGAAAKAPAAGDAKAATPAAGDAKAADTKKK